MTIWNFLAGTVEVEMTAAEPERAVFPVLDGTQ